VRPRRSSDDSSADRAETSAAGPLPRSATAAAVSRSRPSSGMRLSPHSAVFTHYDFSLGGGRRRCNSNDEHCDSAPSVSAVPDSLLTYGATEPFSTSSFGRNISVFPQTSLSVPILPNAYHSPTRHWDNAAPIHFLPGSRWAGATAMSGRSSPMGRFAPRARVIDRRGKGPSSKTARTCLGARPLEALAADRSGKRICSVPTSSA